MSEQPTERERQLEGALWVALYCFQDIGQMHSVDVPEGKDPWRHFYERSQQTAREGAAAIKALATPPRSPIGAQRPSETVSQAGYQTDPKWAAKLAQRQVD